MSETPQRPEIRTLSPGASKLFVIACLVLILGSAVGGAWYLTRASLDNRAQIEANTRPADSTTVRGFGVTEY